jgi:hypothetical protein
MQVIQEELFEIKRSYPELLDALKRMSVSQKTKSSAQGI